MLTVLLTRLFGLFGEEHVIDGFDQLDIERIERDFGPPHEGVDIAPSDWLMAVDALGFPPPDAKPCLPDRGRRGRKRRGGKFCLKFSRNVRPTLPYRPFQTAFETVAPGSPFLPAIKLECALGVSL